ncbi:hypothetical protein [Paraoerskovia sediminicola]|uniref:hypothetical protein n=1 Tax=Paraoerskovia sediminicola TaxID=1138587 RepID=UPI0025731EE5|nr:hypothetical protein [Paraoerskovia sediminicola]
MFFPSSGPHEGVASLVQVQRSDQARRARRRACEVQWERVRSARCAAVVGRLDPWAQIVAAWVAVGAFAAFLLPGSSTVARVLVVGAVLVAGWLSVTASLGARGARRGPYAVDSTVVPLLVVAGVFAAFAATTAGGLPIVVPEVEWVVTLACALGAVAVTILRRRASAKTTVAPVRRH